MQIDSGPILFDRVSVAQNIDSDYVVFAVSDKYFTSTESSVKLTAKLF